MAPAAPPTNNARNPGPLAGTGRQEGPSFPTEEREGEQRLQPGHIDGAILTLSQLVPASSFYPGRGDTGNMLPASTLFFTENNETNITGNDSDVESVADWLDDLDDPTPRQASKFSDAVAIERPLWRVPATVTGPASEVPRCSSQTQVGDVDTSQVGSRSTGSAIDSTLASESSGFVWPADTDIVMPPGSKKVMLTSQCPMLRVVIQDVMENLRADLLFKHAFPDPAVALVTVKDSLLTCASHYPGASSIYRHLLFDDQYMAAITPLPRAQIPLFRSKVKERCAAIVSTEFLAITLAEQRQSKALRQLSKYIYTFSNDSAQACKWPYRNSRIILVIRDLYFSGGSTSFAHQFASLFPMHLGPNGVTMCEVPILMVALVATALYAALYEWRTGVHITAGFTANAYLDVYQGHVGTFNHIQEQKPNVFKMMMADIYSQASAPVVGTSAPIAEISLDELDG
ncbi:hypothetical protein DFH94DRAFT_698694 [Russula ochroleuca]|uniref:DUF6532 domain-containing protein n=1 Tax=Russula ochroleuca TaxID=152965 RepID=A0A9P5JVN0_9AGAM|nr:hypothetical protein DFH94DRAFT_698694 [Russula ochroleuca]